MDKVNGNHDVRIGFYVCQCGTNIAGMVDVQAVAKYVTTRAACTAIRPPAGASSRAFPTTRNS